MAHTQARKRDDTHFSLYVCRRIGYIQAKRSSPYRLENLSTFALEVLSKGLSPKSLPFGGVGAFDAGREVIALPGSIVCTVQGDGKLEHRARRINETAVRNKW